MDIYSDVTVWKTGLNGDLFKENQETYDELKGLVGPKAFSIIMAATYTLSIFAGVIIMLGLYSQVKYFQNDFANRATLTGLLFGLVGGGFTLVRVPNPTNHRKTVSKVDKTIMIAFSIIDYAIMATILLAIV